MRSSQPLNQLCLLCLLPLYSWKCVFVWNTGGIIRSKNMSKHGTNWIQRAVDWLQKSKQSWEMNIKYEEI